MNKYEKLFYTLRKKKEGCFVPFLILGDPSINISLKIIDNIISLGIVDAIELGFPFSDPLSDGPIIQNAHLRSFKSGITLNKCFKMLKIIRNNYPTLPIGLLLYANIIFNYGIEDFYYKCSKFEIDSILIADVPIEEYTSFEIADFRYKISPIFICPPNADLNLIKKISIYSSGYVYIVSRSGVTGYKNTSILNMKPLVNQFKKISSIPLLQGFGIYTPLHIKNAISSGMSGVICGSVIIRQIEKYHENYLLMIKKINTLVLKLKDSTKNSTSLY